MQSLKTNQPLKSADQHPDDQLDEEDLSVQTQFVSKQKQTNLNKRI
jgi:hypothetical protein